MQRALPFCSPGTGWINRWWLCSFLSQSALIHIHVVLSSASLLFRCPRLDQCLLFLFWVVGPLVSGPWPL